MLQEQKRHRIPQNEATLAMLEEEARQYSHWIINTGSETDPVVFSLYLSKFLYVAGKLRRLRVKLQTKGR